MSFVITGKIINTTAEKQLPKNQSECYGISVEKLMQLVVL
jgi:hypothetical protein